MKRLPPNSHGILKLLAWILLMSFVFVLSCHEEIVKRVNTFLEYPMTNDWNLQIEQTHLAPISPVRQNSQMVEETGRLYSFHTTHSNDLDASEKSVQIDLSSLPTIQNRTELDCFVPMISLSGGSFLMGNNTAAEKDQRPQHTVRLSPFRLDKYEVTNQQFKLFVQETGYLTTAERNGWSYIFDMERKEWVRRIGACWWNPNGLASQSRPNNPVFDSLSQMPVVHVSWIDATAFCHWAGKRLPTEAEWEYAAKGGIIDAVYPWGKMRLQDGLPVANFWQGRFPRENTIQDGFLFLSPVGTFPPNNYGLHDLGGNVWEWCADRYLNDYYRRSPVNNPKGPNFQDGQTTESPVLITNQENSESKIENIIKNIDQKERVFLRIIRGGSFLSAENTDAGYRVSARGNHPESLSFHDVGFRCADDMEQQ
ncbi:MAG: formylglycine-generating enzyme family protein [Thermoguttaceae bacterium]